MTNLTIALDADVVRQARIRAISEGTSVSAKLRDFLAQYANAQPEPTQLKPIKLPVYKSQGDMLSGIDSTSNKLMLTAVADVSQSKKSSKKPRA